MSSGSTPRAIWGCDDVTEGTLHNGFGDARVNGLPGMHSDAQTDANIASLERARRESRERSRDAAAAANVGHSAESAAISDTAVSDKAALTSLFGTLSCFTLRDASAGGPELKLYDAMCSPDRQLVRAGYFVAEGSLVVQQILNLGPPYRLVSMLGTEAQLHRLEPELRQADLALKAAEGSTSGEGSAGDPSAEGDGGGEGGEGGAARASGAAGEGGEGPCVVFAGSRADVSKVTGFKHSALSVLAIVKRPATVDRPLSQWLPMVSPVGTMPTLLVLDSVIKPENIGALFRTALAFGVSGVILSPGCADPLYRKSIRASMGGCFKIPYMHASQWPSELDELSEKGYRLLALHLQGSVAHVKAIPSSSTAPFAVMVGAEYEGVSEEAAARAHQRVRIPMSDAMQGSLDSLNVNVAAAIVLERVFSCNTADPS